MKQLFFKTILGICLAFSASLADVSSAPFADFLTEQSKVAVRPEDLPEAVKSTLSGDGYADWKVASAYLITRENNAQYYEINLKKGEETTTVSLDKYGRKVD
ncbi:hypothetical protein [Dyadobacter crusticola]|uniref:hypothetical protein n=1 Tax=Dyadobacter crusticola TaxID=292407 RepID=UPI0004E22355|nr:hypothetical protein [Dyadobacter crusticola]